MRDLFEGFEEEDPSNSEDDDDDDSHHGDATDHDVSSRPKLNKSHFSISKFFREKNLTVESVTEITRLEDAIKNRSSRHRLVDALLTLKDDLSIKVRFVSAVDEFLHAEGKDRRKMGKQIVKMFINPSSMFHISHIAPHHEQALLAKKYENLEDVRMAVLCELAHNELVKKTVAEVL